MYIIYYRCIQYILILTTSFKPVFSAFQMKWDNLSEWGEGEVICTLPSRKYSFFLSGFIPRQSCDWTVSIIYVYIFLLHNCDGMFIDLRWRPCFTKKSTLFCLKERQKPTGCIGTEILWHNPFNSNDIKGALKCEVLEKRHTLLL